MFPKSGKTEGKIVMNEFKFLHDYLRELRMRKYEARAMKKSSSKNSLKQPEPNKGFRRAKSMFIHGEGPSGNFKDFLRKGTGGLKMNTLERKWADPANQNKKIDRTRRKKIRSRLTRLALLAPLFGAAASDEVGGEEDDFLFGVLGGPPDS